MFLWVIHLWVSQEIVLNYALWYLLQEPFLAGALPRDDEFTGLRPDSLPRDHDSTAPPRDNEYTGLFPSAKGTTQKKTFAWKMAESKDRIWPWLACLFHVWWTTASEWDGSGLLQEMASSRVQVSEAVWLTYRSASVSESGPESDPVRAVHLSRRKWPGSTRLDVSVHL